MDKQEKYELPFATRLRNLLDERGTTITALSKALGISRQAVSQYADGTGQPNVDKLRMIADYFGVSTDYLVGLSEIPSRNETIQGVNEYTGLSQDAIATLYTEKYLNESELADFVSFLLVSEEFPRLIKTIQQKNELRDNQVGHIDIDGVEHEITMKGLLKKIVEDLFWSIIDDYTVKPGEILVGYRKGCSNG